MLLARCNADTCTGKLLAGPPDKYLSWTSTGTEIEVHLVPTVNYPPKLRKIIDRVLQDLNATDLTLPDGSGRKLRLRLTRKEQIEVRVRDLDEN